MLTRLTPLNGEAILPLDECKIHLQITHSDEDVVLRAMRDAAISHVERVSGVALALGDYRWTLPRFTGALSLPVRPVHALTSVSYTDAAGAAATYPDARLMDGAIYPASGAAWPYAAGYVSVVFEAGLQDPSDEPGLLQAALMQLSILEDRGRSDEKTINAMRDCVAALIGTHQQIMA